MIPEKASLCKMFSKWGFLKLQAFAGFFHQRFQLGIIESHGLRKIGFQFCFWNPNLPAKECPHPIQPNLKDIPRKMFHKNVSFYFGLPILMFFSSIFHCKTCHNSWQPVLKPNICAELSSQNRKSYFEIRNVNKPLKYWCRKTFVMFQIQIECKIIHWALWNKLAQVVPL